MKRIVCSILALALAISTLCGIAQAAKPNSSSSIISTALSQLDYEEGPRSYSKYGQWYGVTYGDWCDMFVSWCANEAGISKAIFPRSAGCTTHVRLFSKITPYQVSAARGGTYVPKQGDVIFFYDYVEYPNANVVRHTGIVLCVENGYVFTIEGNTLTSRHDYRYCDDIIPRFDETRQPNDYVAVKYYPLNDRQIHGYASPNYTDRTVFAHNGWVDLGKYESMRGIFNTLAAQGIMPGTSSYTFSPRYGMTRGEFLTLVMNLYGLSGWESTMPFADVPQGSSCYNAVMTARSAGIVNGTGKNTFKPNIYISGPEAQAIISRTLAYVGQENQVFQFSQGDLSYMLTPYTIRADIARALYTLYSKMSAPAQPAEKLALNGEPLNWSMLRVNGGVYVPLKMVRQDFPTLSAASDSPEGQPARQPVPMNNISRVFVSDTILQNGAASNRALTFNYYGVQYVSLHHVALVLGMKLQWNLGSDVIELFQKVPET